MTLKHFQIRWPREWLKRTRLFRTDMLSYSGKDFIVSMSLYLVSVICCLVLRNFDPQNDTSYVSMIFLLDVFLTALLTDGFFFSLTIAVFAVLSVDYIFPPPYWEVSFTLAGFPLTFLVMMTICVATGIVTSRAKRVSEMEREAEREKIHSNLLRAVSHDIRTPLTSVLGYLDLLEEMPELPAEEPEVPWVIRGELFHTYVVVEQGETALFIDKHAAHERIRFEALKKEDHPIMAQLLLAPVSAELSREEAAAGWTPCRTTPNACSSMTARALWSPRTSSAAPSNRWRSAVRASRRCP